MNLKTVIFIGKSGSGKGTQARALEVFLNNNGDSVCHFETGAALRELASESSYTGELVKKTLGGGNMQPLFLAVWLWSNIFVTKLTGHEHIICDGFPRRTPEADTLDTAMEFYGRENVDVVHCMLTDEQVFERLSKRGRNDDTEDGIKRRIDWFNEEVVPVIEYFKGNDRYIVHDIDASKSEEETFADIKKAIGV